LIDKEGHAIKYDCTLCHSILAYDSPGPFTNLQAIDTTLADSKMQAFLQDEFFEKL